MTDKLLHEEDPRTTYVAMMCGCRRNCTCMAFIGLEKPEPYLGALGV